MADPEDNTPQFNTYKKLDARKNALEIKLGEKCFELKKLCIAEAELTGIMPFEIPLDPDESPPLIRRRIGTMFPYTDDVINQLAVNQVPNIPVNVLGRSPKRKNPLFPWNNRCGTLTPKQSEPSTHSPKNFETWPSKNKSPLKQGLQRSHPYKAKFNIFKRSPKR